MKTVTYVADDETATAALAAALAEVLPDRAIVALNGTLGAGKTRFVQALATAAGVAAGTVVSPTFVLVQEYSGRRPIYHFDAYRLRDDDEFLELGPEEYFAAQGWSVIEWAERVERCLPRERLEIAIAVTGPTSRRFALTGLGSTYEQVVERMSAWIQTTG